uniref:Triacylglycerol lipase n=1 Tax=Solanum tuberosum TaxID=4113 RepID=M0ZMK0_SOLTU
MEGVLEHNVTDLEFLLKLRVVLDSLLTTLSRSCKLKQAFKIKIAKRMKGKT